MYRQRTKLDPNWFYFYEQQGVVVKINSPWVQHGGISMGSDSTELNLIWFIFGFVEVKANATPLL